MPLRCKGRKVQPMICSLNHIIMSHVYPTHASLTNKNDSCYISNSYTCQQRGVLETWNNKHASIALKKYKMDTIHFSSIAIATYLVLPMEQ